MPGLCSQTRSAASIFCSAMIKKKKSKRVKFEKERAKILTEDQRDKIWQNLKSLAIFRGLIWCLAKF